MNGPEESPFLFKPIGVAWEAYQFFMSGTSLTDHIFAGMARNGQFYEQDLLLATRDLVKLGDFVVDAGANIGNHSVFWAGVCGARVLAVEPSPLIHKVLRENVQVNDLESSVFPRAYALGNSAGRARVIPGSRDNSGQTRIEGAEDGAVLVRPLDEVPEVADNKVSMIKIDVEGMELEVLEGARSLLERDNPVVLCECLDDDQYTRVNSFLSRFGYLMMECYNYSPTYLFAHKSWEYPAGFTRMDHLVAITGRNSRLLNALTRDHMDRRRHDRDA